MVIVPAGDPDDLYLLQYARVNQGFVVSNDFFNDHIQSLPAGDAAELTSAWLEKCRCSYAFIKNGHRGIFMPNPGSSMMDVLENFRYKDGGDNKDYCNLDEDEMEMDTI